MTKIDLYKDTAEVEKSLYVKDLYNFDPLTLRGMRTTFSKVVYLTKAGISTMEISNIINIRYQHVRNEQHRAGLIDQARKNNLKK